MDGRKEGRGLWKPSSLLFVLLSLSVFLWGTSYKLSLYKSDPCISLTPAKLCKLTSDNAKSQADNAIGARALQGQQTVARSFGAVPAAITMEMGAVVITQRSGADVWDGFRPLRTAPVLHVRPPPYLSHRTFG